MKDWLLAIIFKPLLILAVFVLVCLPIRMAVQRWLPPGKVKAVILKNRSGPDATMGDKVLMAGSVIAIYGLLFAGFYFLS